MVAEANKINQPEGNKVLDFPTPQQPLDKILTELEIIEPSIIGDLESQSENQLLVRWKEASTLGRHEWFLKAAICAATWNQTKAAKRGRENKDVNQKGLLASISRRAKKFGITPSRVYQKNQVFKLIVQVREFVPENNLLEILDEEGYWEKALLAAEPMKIVLVFAERKTTQKRFRVTDAERLVLTPEYSRKAVALKAVDSAREETGQLSVRQTLIQHIRSAQETIRTSLIPSCPDAEFKARVWDELLVELEEEYDELFSEDASLALRTAWANGHHREDEMAKVTNLPLADVSKFMDGLADMSEFIRVQPRDINQRAPYQLWHKVGEPFDNAKLLPMVLRG
jgi:hypothetical protein